MWWNLGNAALALRLRRLAGYCYGKAWDQVSREDLKELREVPY